MIRTNYKRIETLRKSGLLQFRTIKPAIIVITCIALFFQIVGLNKPHLLPVYPGVDSQMIIQKLDTDQGSLIIDSQGKRLLFTNSDNKLIGVYETRAQGSPITVAVSAKFDGDKYIVHGCSSINDGNYIKSESLISFSVKGNYIEEIEKIDYSEQEYVTVLNSKLKIYNSSDIRFDEIFSGLEMRIDYSFLYFIQNLFFWVSGVWLLLFVIVFIIWLLTKKLKRLSSAIFISILCVVATAAFYTNYNIQSINESFSDALHLITKFVDQAAYDNIDKLEEISNVGANEYFANKENQVAKDRLEDRVMDYIKLSSKEKSYTTKLISISSDGKLYYIFDSSNLTNFGKEIEVSNEQIKDSLINGESFEVKHATTSVVDSIYETSTIWSSDGRPIAVIITSAKTDNIVSTQAVVSGQLFVDLLAILIGIYILISGLALCKDAFLNCMKRDKSDIRGRAADMAGAYKLIFHLACNIDGVLVVYIATSLCSDADPVIQATLAALPIAIGRIGQCVGTFCSPVLMKKFGMRRCGIVFSVLGLGGMILAAFSISIDSIIVYSLAKLLIGLTLRGVIYVLGDNLPLFEKDKSKRNDALLASSKGSLAGSIISILASGYISQYLGYYAVYFIGAILSCVIILLTLITFSNKCEQETENQDQKLGDKSVKKSWLIFLKPELLMYVIFFSFPSVLVSGYSSYLFPLYAQGIGISTVVLSNLSVFTTMAVYITSGPLRAIVTKWHFSFRLVVPGLIVCLGLVCFFISPNLYWAFIMLFVLSIVMSVSAFSGKTYVLEVAEKYKLDITNVQANNNAIYNGLSTFQTPILSTFAGYGLVFACTLIGLVCAGFYSVFGFFCKKRKL